MRMRVSRWVRDSWMMGRVVMASVGVWLKTKWEVISPTASICHEEIGAPRGEEEDGYHLVI